MAEPDTSLESRVAHLEVQELETRRIVAMHDRDLADVHLVVNAQTHLMQALRETQIEQGRTLVDLGHAVGLLITGQESHRLRLDGIDQRLDGMDQRFDGMDQRFDGIDQRLDGMDQRFDGIGDQLREIITVVRSLAEDRPDARA